MMVNMFSIGNFVLRFLIWFALELLHYRRHEFQGRHLKISTLVSKYIFVLQSILYTLVGYGQWNRSLVSGLTTMVNSISKPRCKSLTLQFKKDYQSYNISSIQDVLKGKKVLKLSAGIERKQVYLGSGLPSFDCIKMWVKFLKWPLRGNLMYPIFKVSSLGTICYLMEQYFDYFIKISCDMICDVTLVLSLWTFLYRSIIVLTDESATSVKDVQSSGPTPQPPEVNVVSPTPDDTAGPKSPVADTGGNNISHKFH